MPCGALTRVPLHRRCRSQLAQEKLARGSPPRRDCSELSRRLVMLYLTHASWAHGRSKHLKNKWKERKKENKKENTALRRRKEKTTSQPPRAQIKQCALQGRGNEEKVFGALKSSSTRKRPSSVKVSGPFSLSLSHPIANSRKIREQLSPRRHRRPRVDPPPAQFKQPRETTSAMLKEGKRERGSSEVRAKPNTVKLKRPPLLERKQVVQRDETQMCCR